MAKQNSQFVISLYQEDETGWLEQTAELVEQKRFGEIDSDDLSHFLRDMARRDKREVLSRLTVLLAHFLKWEHQSEKRSGSWMATIVHQQDALSDLLASRTLFNYAREVLGTAYARAVKRAALEAGLAADAFPAECPWAVDELLSRELQ